MFQSSGSIAEDIWVRAYFSDLPRSELHTVYIDFKHNTSCTLPCKFSSGGNIEEEPWEGLVSGLTGSEFMFKAGLCFWSLPPSLCARIRI